MKTTEGSQTNFSGLRKDLEEHERMFSRILDKKEPCRQERALVSRVGVHKPLGGSIERRPKKNEKKSPIVTGQETHFGPINDVGGAPTTAT